MHQTAFLEIQTPDGNRMKFRGFADKGGDNAWFRTRLTGKLLSAKQKQRLPILGCWNAGPQKLVLVDYDAKSAEQAAQARKLCDEAAALYPNAVRFDSVSGNPRVAFLVEVQDGAAWGTAEAAAYLRRVLPQEGHWFDTCGMQRLYVNKAVAQMLAEKVPALPAERVEASREEAEASRGYSITTNQASRQVTYYRASSSQLPQGLRLWAKDALRQGLLQILTAAWGLATSQGFNLPVNALATNLNCTPTQASRMLKELQTLGVLSCIDPTTVMHKKARTYRAAGCLLGAIQEHRRAATAGKAASETQDAALETAQLLDGKAYKTLLWGLSRHQTKAGYMAWVDSLPGLNARRRSEALKYYQCHERKRAAA